MTTRGRRAVHEPNLTQAVVEGDPDAREAPGDDGLDGSLGRGGDCVDTGDDLPFGVSEYLFEQALLAAEVVIDRPFGG